MSSAVSADPGGGWRGPDGRPLPFADDEQALDFLRSARVVSQRELSGGSNRPLKVRLAKDGVEAHAIFRTVDVKRRRAKIYDRVYLGFHDSCFYECAAYELSRVLGLSQVPPCVKRRHQMRHGTLQLWIEGAMTEGMRRADGKDPPATLEWLLQKQTMRLFDALIYNYDRNLGNMLIDGDWRLWFIDHTRSFHKSAEIEELDRIVWCERGLWQKLQALDRNEVQRRLRPFVSSPHVGYLFQRRDRLVAHLRTRIAELGEQAVIVDGGRAEGLSGLDVAAAEDDFPEKSANPDTGIPDR